MSFYLLVYLSSQGVRKKWWSAAPVKRFGSGLSKWSPSGWSIARFLNYPAIEVYLEKFVVLQFSINIFPAILDDLNGSSSNNDSPTWPKSKKPRNYMILLNDGRPQNSKNLLLWHLSFHSSYMLILLVMSLVSSLLCFVSEFISLVNVHRCHLTCSYMSFLSYQKVYYFLVPSVACYLSCVSY